LNWKGILVLAAALIAVPPLAGCAARARSGGASIAPEPMPPAPEPPAMRDRGAFSVQGRIQGPDGSRRFGMRVWVEAPDRLRAEIRGAVGGVALVATADAGAVRIVVPSRRLYTESRIEEEIGTDILGIPVSGCDLAMVLRIASGLRRFRPCGADGTDGGAAPAAESVERPGMIVDTSLSGEEMIRFGFDWTGGGDFPRETRVEILGEEETTLSLSGFEWIDWPRSQAPDFYREPLPAGARRATRGEIAAEGPR